MDDSGPRFQAFRRVNPGLQADVLIGSRGDSMSHADRISQGLVTDDLARSGLLHDGTFGCALSHRRLWQEACQCPGGTLILEDDVVCHPHLADWIEEHQASLLKSDITHFGLNTDSVVVTLTAQALVQMSVFEPKHPDHAWIERALQSTRLGEVRFEQLLKGFGMCCYFVSPAGAQALLAKAFPLTLEASPIPLVSKAMPGCSIDRRLNAFYPSLRAGVTRPFLAYTPNDDSSTK